MKKMTRSTAVKLSLASLTAAALCSGVDPAVADTAVVTTPVTVAATAGAPAEAPSFPVVAGAVWVSPTGSDTAAGTRAAPLRTVARAVVAAPAGGMVVLRGGTYHEDVDVPYQKTLTIQNAPGETVWFDGSTALRTWTAEGGAWRSDGWTARFDRTDPTGLVVTAAAPLSAWPEQVWRGGTALKQVADRASVKPGTFWIDTVASRVWVGDDPTGKEVRATDLREGLYVQKGEGSVVRGVGFRRYATSLARVAALKVFADDAVIDSVRVEGSATAGLSVSGSDITISHSSFTDNGQIGLHATKSDRLTLDGVVASHNNLEGFATGHHSGGAKFTTLQDLTVRNSRFEDNVGMGLWLDESVERATVSNSVMSGNSTNGFQLEISSGLVFAGNLVYDNAANGVRILDSSGAQIWNNVLSGNRSAIDLLDGPRVGTDLTVRGHDNRFPLPDADQTWEVEDITVSGNVMMSVPSTTKPLLGLDDARRVRSLASRRITVDRNTYWRPTATTPSWLANAADGSAMKVGTSVRDFAARTGLELQGTGADGGLAPVAISGATARVQRPELLAPADTPAAVLRALAGGSSVTSTSTSTSTGTGTGSGLRAGLPGFSRELVAPTAALSVGCDYLSCSLDASRSADADGGALSYRWDLGDGSSATGARPADHAYDRAGTYTVRLTVTDPDGLKDSAVEQVTVHARPVAPVAALGASCDYLVCSLDGSGSSDPDGTVTAWSWDLGDGRSASGQQATHEFSAPGAYPVRLTVTDTDGLTDSQQTTLTVSRRPVAPVAAFTVSCDELTCTLDGSGSSDEDGSLTSWSWDLGDGTTATGPVVEHTYPASGTSDVRLTVQDDQGLSATYGQTVKVTAPLVRDGFTRFVTRGFGEVRPQVLYRAVGGTQDLSVEDGHGVLTLPTPGAGRGALLESVTSTDTDAAVTFDVESAPTGSGHYVYLDARAPLANTMYRARLRYLVDGTVRAAFYARVGTSEVLVGKEVVVPGLDSRAVKPVRLRAEVTGTSPTRLRMRAWDVAQTEPAAWLLDLSDSTPVLQQAGGIGVHAYLAATAAGPVRVRVDDLVAWRPTD